MKATPNKKQRQSLLVNSFSRLSKNGAFGPEIARATTQNDSKFLKKTASRKKTPSLHHHKLYVDI